MKTRKALRTLKEVIQFYEARIAAVPPSSPRPYRKEAMVAAMRCLIDVFDGRGAEELAWKSGFDAGVQHQREASPPPRAAALARELAAVTAERDALRALVEPSPLVEAVKAVTP